MSDLFWLFILALPISFLFSTYIRRRWLRYLLSIPAGFIPVIILVLIIYISNFDPYFAAARAFNDIIFGVLIVWLQLWIFRQRSRQKLKNIFDLETDQNKKL